MDRSPEFPFKSWYWTNHVEGSHPQFPQPSMSYGGPSTNYTGSVLDFTSYSLQQGIDSPRGVSGGDRPTEGASTLSHAPTLAPMLPPLDNNIGETSNQGSRRNKYGRLDWDGHRDVLKKYYLTENKTLPETMEIMKSQYGFEASFRKKLYKDRFRAWNWNKNLPTQIAEFMDAKLKQRQETGSQTIFVYGERTWDRSRVESTLSRSKRRRTANEPIDMSTPAGVKYETPREVRDSSSESTDSEDSQNDITVSQQGNPSPSLTVVDDDQAPSLTWNGHTRSQVLHLLDDARGFSMEGEAEAAEQTYIRALEGTRHLIGVIHKESNKVAYELANFYAQAGSHKEADAILDEVTRLHFKKLGPEHKRTQQHVIDCVELLNTWNRQDDALGLMAHSKEILESRQAGPRRRRNRRNKNNSKGKTLAIMPAASNGSVDLPGRIPASASGEDIQHLLEVAHSHVDSHDEHVETLLLGLIDHCEKDLPKLFREYLQAHGELLGLYGKLRTAELHKAAFETARIVLSRVWVEYVWDEKKYESFEIIEAYLQVVTNMVKCGYKGMARRLFHEAAEKAEVLYDPTDERCIWISITIGLVYQTYHGWDEAEEWFDRAYAGALGSKWGEDDGIVRSLETARGKKHFSYLTDEGRPFKTVFGVSGLTIRPKRLHLE
ncbi:unnamed protein product [Clonostachys solani]|uniref:Clr5 domain-containing protein n=1 Tax=Clonostachys solani TaxID=160281 RepID=A0A9P0EIH3_9HYPO|nr:unnamed protein product [Clonostachys solani]